ncbi:hypothetical protein N7456_003333 [Penicillium angulare]|uniref:Uncharacterized protein n=1 Tax=Penicillium angulare TaxID=116970 RepID=A0A9W9FUL5_9EURO|nr:hypothetical protein N7456_003333 [Penicillium angulare]
MSSSSRVQPAYKTPRGREKPTPQSIRDRIKSTSSSAQDRYLPKTPSSRLRRCPPKHKGAIEIPQGFNNTQHINIGYHLIDLAGQYPWTR